MSQSRPLRRAYRRFLMFFQSRGLQFTLSLSFSLAAIVGMILLTVFITVRSDANTEKLLRAESERTVSQLNVNLDLVLRDVMRISDSLYYRVLKQNELESPKTQNDFILLYESNSSKLSAVGLFDEHGGLLLSMPINETKTLDVVKEQAWFKNALSEIENIHVSQPFVQRIFGDATGYDWVISLSRSVQLTQNGSVSQGVLALDMKYSLIEQIFKNIDMRNQAYVYLTNIDGQIIYHPRQQLIFSGVIDENNTINASYSDGVTIENFHGGQRMVTVKTVGYTGWKIIAVNPTDAGDRSITELRIYTMFIFLLSIFLVVLTNYVLSAYIVKPIKRLEQNVLELEQGKTATFSADCDSHPEICHLSRAIAALVKQQEQLRADILFEQESKRRSEMETLQAQIHPHFLYNTLDSIVWMIENERYSGATEMVSSLAQFFRLSLARSENIVTVEQELEQVKSYLSIQKVRYRNRFEYTITAEEEVKQCLTIKLIVQPLVENSILHGMDSLDDEGEIKIHAYQKEGELYIDVFDNGLGMTEDQSAYLLKEKPPRNELITSGGAGIGVANVNKRIKLFFGESYGLMISSTPDEGTLARIHLPISVRTEITPES